MRWFRGRRAEPGRVPGGDVDWAAFPWPEPGAYHRERILDALRAVIEPRRRDWSDAATMVRAAVGNDHRGTVYPAAVAMTGHLLAIAEKHPGRPRRVALCVLDDWWSNGFEAERGAESYVDASGNRVEVIPRIAGQITAAAGLLARMAQDAADPDGAALARDLLAAIPLGWGNIPPDFSGGTIPPA